MTRIVMHLFLLIALVGMTTTGCVTTSEKNYIAIGNQYAKDGLLREAAESYKKALAKNYKKSTANRNLGLVLVKMGEYKAAIRHLEKAMATYENDFDANFYLGEAYRANDKYSEAIFRYNKALKIEDNNPKALKPLAWSYFKIRYYSEALITARKLNKVAPQDDQSGIILSRTLLKMKRSREAYTVLKAAKKDIDRGSRPYYNSVEGDILFDLKKIKGAMTAYKSALKDQPLLAGALLGIGRCMMEINKPEIAITYMERAVRIRPRLTEAHYLLGKAYENKDKQKSLRYYHHFAKQASADPEFLAILNDVKIRIGQLQKSQKTSKN